MNINWKNYHLYLIYRNKTYDIVEFSLLLEFLHSDKQDHYDYVRK